MARILQDFDTTFLHVDGHFGTGRTGTEDNVAWASALMAARVINYVSDEYQIPRGRFSSGGWGQKVARRVKTPLAMKGYGWAELCIVRSDGVQFPQRADYFNGIEVTYKSHPFHLEF